MNEATPEPRRCEVCGGPLDRKNRSGICGQTQACSAGRPASRDAKAPAADMKLCEPCRSRPAATARYASAGGPAALNAGRLTTLSARTGQASTLSQSAVGISDATASTESASSTGA